MNIHEEAVEQWRAAKRARLLAAGEVVSNTRRLAESLPPICNCDLCEGDDHDTPIADR